MNDEYDREDRTAPSTPVPVATNPVEPSQAELAALVEALVRQDEAALACLYQHTVHRVYRLALAITRQVQDAEEVVCDVYWQVWQRAHQYDPKRGTVLAWLLIQSRSLAIDLLRRRRARDDANTEVDPYDVPDEAAAAEALLTQVVEGSAVHQALSTLSAIQRHIIELAYFHDLSHRAIALKTQLPLGTVKSHLRRGLQKLRTALEMPVSDHRDDLSP